MGLLQAKPEKTEVVGVRVPTSLKRLLNDLRAEAELAGFDLTATLTEALQRAAKQIAAELSEFKAKTTSAAPKSNVTSANSKPDIHANGTSKEA
jgi:hypothetical protein